MNTRSRCCHLLVIGTLGAACGDRGRPPVPDGFVTYDSAGVTVTMNYGIGSASWKPWALSPDPVVAIGVRDGPEPYQFFRIAGATRLDDGTIVVLDRGSAEVRGFSPDGEHIWTAGSRGDGPGEMRDPDFIERLNGDTIQVQDGTSRLRFVPPGRLVEHSFIDMRRVSELGLYIGESCRGLPSFVGDHVLLCTSEYHPPWPEPGDWQLFTLVVRGTWALLSVDTIGSFFIQDGWRAVDPITDRTQSITSPLGPRGHLRLNVADDPAILYSRTDRYRIDAYSVPAAELSSVVGRDAARRTWTPAEIELAVRWGPNAPEIRSQLSADDERLSRLDSIAPHVDWFVDRLGFLWTALVTDGSPRREVTTPDGTSAGMVPYRGGDHDIFAPDHTYLGKIQLPAGLELMEVGADYILGLVRDELSVESIVLYHLDRRDDARRSDGADADAHALGPAG